MTILIATTCLYVKAMHVFSWDELNEYKTFKHIEFIYCIKNYQGR